MFSQCRSRETPQRASGKIQQALLQSSTFGGLMKKTVGRLSDLPLAERRKLLEGAASEELIERMQSIDEWRKKQLEEFVTAQPLSSRRDG
jgi:hypothetical protein